MSFQIINNNCSCHWGSVQQSVQSCLVCALLLVNLTSQYWNTRTPRCTLVSCVAGPPQFLGLMIDIHLAISSVHPALGFVVRFFQFFDQLRRLRMWKMQLLDEHHLFIKYTSEDVVTLRVTDPSQVETHTHTHIWIPLCVLFVALSCLSSVFCCLSCMTEILLSGLQGRVSPSDSVQSCDSLMATANRSNYYVFYLHEVSALWLLSRSPSFISPMKKIKNVIFIINIKPGMLSFTLINIWLSLTVTREESGGLCYGFKRKYIYIYLQENHVHSNHHPLPPVLPQPSFFVVYNMVSTEVLAVFENTSDQLLELFENFCDLFRNATLHSQAVQFPCSASSNNYARQVQRRYGGDKTFGYWIEIPNTFSAKIEYVSFWA